MAVDLFEHNQQTYQKMISMFKERNRVGVVQPTGTGKSFLYLKWIEDHPNDTFAILSPSTEIFKQLQEYAEASDARELLDSVLMISYQSLLRMTDEEVLAIHPDKMVLDEFHRTGADLWGPSLLRLLNANPNAQVLGASATPVRYLDDSKDMASELFDRNLAVEMTLGEAVQRKILPTPIYVPVWYDLDGTMSRYEKDVARVFSPQKRRALEDKLDQLKRRLESSYGAEDIFRKHMPHDHAKFIVFCRSQEHLAEMVQTMPKWLSGVNPIIHSYVSISAQEDRDHQLEAFKADRAEDAIKLLFTIDRLNEGLHVKGIDGVIMLRPTESPMIYLQQMGRALSVNHDNPIIFDMVNNYQNVQIPLRDGSSVNVFEKEFREALGDQLDLTSFRIFEDMISFTNLFSELESLLYLSNDEKWEEHYRVLLDFISEFDCFPSSYEVYKDFHIGRWCLQQRNSSVKDRMPQDRYEKLEKIGLFACSRYASWDRNFQLLLAYKAQFGCFPKAKEMYKGVNLGRWYNKQKMALLDQSLSRDKAEKLLALGVAETSLDAIWDRNYQMLSEFVTDYNRFPMVSDRIYGFNIGKWYFKQKHLAKSDSMPEYRLSRLQAIGFSVDRSHLSWEESYLLLSEFVKDCDRLPKVSESYKGYNLGQWWFKQKYKLKRNELSDYKAQKLEEIFHHIRDNV